MLLAMRRRASSLPRLCGRSTSMGCDIGLIQWAAVQRFSSALRGMVGDASSMLAAARRANRPRPAPPARGARCWNPAADLHHRRPGRARLPSLVPGDAVGARRRSKRSTSISRPTGRRSPADLAAAPHRDLVAEMRRPAVRNPADSRMAEHRPDAALRPRLCDPGRRAGRSRYRSIATRRSTMRGRCAGKRAQALFGDRHGPAAADHAREADARALRGSSAARRAITRSASASTPSFASTSTRPNFGAGTWTRRVAAECPPIVHPRMRRRSASRCRDPAPSPAAPQPVTDVHATPPAQDRSRRHSHCQALVLPSVQHHIAPKAKG